MNAQFIFRVLRSLRLRWTFSRHAKGVIYRRGEISVSVQNKSMEQLIFGKPSSAPETIVRTLAHEVGHFLLAPPARRRQDDYGISNKAKRGPRSAEKWTTDEERASLIGDYLIWHSGFRKKAPTPHGKPLSDWWDSEGKRLTETIVSLALGPAGDLSPRKTSGA